MSLLCISSCKIVNKFIHNSFFLQTFNLFYKRMIQIKVLKPASSLDERFQEGMQKHMIYTFFSFSFDSNDPIHTSGKGVLSCIHLGG